MVSLFSVDISMVRWLGGSVEVLFDWFAKGCGDVTLDCNGADLRDVVEYDVITRR